MNAAQEHVYAEIGDEHAQEGKDAIDVEKHRLLEGFPYLLVQWRSIDEQGDERPDFLRIPRPIVAP